MRPDLTCFGKVIGGGLPIGAFGGRADVMGVLAPLGPVYQAGTLSGNPLATAAGLAALELLERRGLRAARATGGPPGRRARRRARGGRRPGARCPTVGPLRRPALRARRRPSTTTPPRPPTRRCYAAFFHALLDRGVALAPGPYEVAFPGLAHTDDVLDEIVDRAPAPPLRSI